MKQWSKDIYLLNWDDACEKAKLYSENTDGTDRGSWRLPTPEELKDFTLIEDKDLSFWTSLEGLSTSTVFYLKHGSMSSVFKRNRIPTVFVRYIPKENKIEEENMKLEWEQNPPSNRMTWDEAMKYAESLNTMSDYGWRLPTKEELKHAYDNDLEGFQSNYYWSSSTYALSAGIAWGVHFGFGHVFNVYKTSDSYYVRCVRYIKEETVREPFSQIRDLVQVQEKSALMDDYNLGLYNGMELCLSILEKREPKYKDLKYKDLNPTSKQTIPRYRIDVLKNLNKQIIGIKYELEENGNWIQYNDVRNLIEKQEHILSELKKLLNS